MSLVTPIAFFIFNRPDLTQTTFEAIARMKPAKLLVVADGARSIEEAEKCRATREVIEQVDWKCEVLTDYSEKNLGCKKRVASGINWVFSKVEEAIILEDDCLASPSFFEYCQTLLERYRNDKRVMHIGGGNFLFNQVKLDSSYYFSRYSFAGYGWATWRRAWQLYDPDMTSWTAFRDSGNLDLLFEDAYERDYWRSILERTWSGDIDTWDFQWFYTCWMNGGLCALPNVNLVANLGFRADATHTHTAYERSYLATIEAGDLGEITHPQFMVRHRLADIYAFETYFGRNNLDRGDERIIKLRQRLVAIKGRLRRAISGKQWLSE